ncbi:D-alanyl-D-alanine carboxypeptidase (penicillin-binding protein 5/6) [Rhizobiales bacterium GAS191]|nr:D-alanyl-D-alanine carboxypeptidase (penicillin-binding protein 5/6) [Rhizobiales bacterium GAS113]SED94210.1 D-alanyl-D-alanine carboxypeptidase (penicillin-binding protein 5/6) [Rhizobiales bacterium GAS191]
MRPAWPKTLFAGLLAALFLACAPAYAADTIQIAAQQALLMDAASGTILFEKNARTPMVPASLAKLMTAEMVFDQIKQGKLTLDQDFVISENAWRKGGAPSGGSTMFAAIHSHVSIADLISGLIVLSGNDAAIALAEGIAGGEFAFGEMMTRHAKEIGLTASTFRNATGADDPDQRSTALDLALLARHVILTYPELYKYFGQKEFTWNKIRQLNRNPLLTMDIGADGLNTGRIDEPGIGLVGSAVQGGQRLIVVINGAATPKDRAAEGRKLLEYGFRAFEGQDLFPEGAVITQASVYGGAKSTVDLRADGPVRVVTQRGGRERLSAKLLYQGPLMPPVAAGMKVGVLRVYEGEASILEVPLFAAESVGQGDLARQAQDALLEAGSGAIRRLLKR